MIDSHAHIHDEKFGVDRDEVARRAREAGVCKMVTIGTSIQESRDAIQCAEKYKGVFATVAVHPEEYSKLPDVELQTAWMEELSRLSENPKVVAIGECGLDYHAFNGIAITDKQKECQKQGFLEHLELSSRTGKPIVIHARESYEDVLELLRTFVSKIPNVILHCYQGDTKITEKFLGLGEKVNFSFAGNITYPVKKLVQGTDDDIREVVRMIPIGRILSETDCPYLAPQKFRGTRNEPAYVVEVVRAIAEFKAISLEETARQTCENAERIFRI